MFFYSIVDNFFKYYARKPKIHQDRNQVFFKNRQELVNNILTYKEVRFAVVIFVSTMNSSGLATKGRKNMHTVAAIFNKLFF